MTAVPNRGDGGVGETGSLGRFAPATLRAAGWTVLSLRRARQVLRSEGISGRIPFPPARLPVGASRGVLAVLARTKPTCLERATVLQTWLSAHRQPVDIVVGVAADKGDVTAHAWIEPGTPAAESAQYREIHRIPPPVPN